MALRSVTVRSFAKINLDLRVLHRRADGFHELRTVFQTISLADTLSVGFERSRRTRISIEGNVEIPDNLVLRAARAVLDVARVGATIAFTLKKRIPMGAGLGGGSSNAAAVLLALPVLAGTPITIEKLAAIAAELGSDVPFFLYGGTALGIGRGIELYPLPDVAGKPGVLVAPPVHVSTAEAYRDLGRNTLAGPLTTEAPGFDTVTFRSLVWAMAEQSSAGGWMPLCANDFERAVFQRHPALLAIKKRLIASGARPALMTGSGSALFGLYDSRDSAAAALTELSPAKGEDAKVFRIELLSRRRYRALWRKQLAAHVTADAVWPPRTRYSKS